MTVFKRFRESEENHHKGNFFLLLPLFLRVVDGDTGMQLFVYLFFFFNYDPIVKAVWFNKSSYLFSRWKRNWKM